MAFSIEPQTDIMQSHIYLPSTVKIGIRDSRIIQNGMQNPHLKDQLIVLVEALQVGQNSLQSLSEIWAW